MICSMMGASMSELWLTFVMGLFVGLLMGTFIGDGASDFGWEQRTLQRGLAIYCPTNGQWAWLGECDK